MENNVFNSSVINTQSGAHVVDGPLTTSIAREASEDLLMNEIDSRVVKIRPMSTPIDQISRMVGSRPAGSMVVEYYSVDSRPVAAKLTATPVKCKNQGDLSQEFASFLINTENNRIFAPTDTLLVKDYTECTIGNQPLMLYVRQISSGPDGGVMVVPINLNEDEISPDEIPQLPIDSLIVRMGRAAAELDVQTAQYEALPIKDKNYCQIFKTQVEQSTYARLSAKEVGWTFSDQEEVAIMDMRMGMEKSFLFGSKARYNDPEKADEVLFTQGIWNQAQTTHSLPLADIKQSDLISLMKKAFTGEAAGSSKKILIAGSEMIESISNIDTTKVVMSSETVTRWGIDFNELRSKFGTLYVIHSEVFDQCGHGTNGLIVDPQYLTKYVHVPFKVEHLDLKKSGVRNTDALVATEASCLVLRHPKTHIKVIGQ